jgi:adenylate cyclase
MTRTAARREPEHRCVAFVDLAGFTALTDVHGDDAAADVYDAFVGAIQAAEAIAPDLHCVKHLGDGALLAARTADQMVTGLVRGLAETRDEQLCLRLRAGIHVGDVLRLDTVHGEDYLGHTVNVAARLCGLAAPGEALLSTTAVRAVGSMGSSLHRLGMRQLRHIASPVEVWAMGLATGAMSIDPVCHMSVPEDVFQHVYERSGQLWRFCSVECRTRFVDEHG